MNLNLNLTQSPADRAMEMLREIGGKIGVAVDKLWPKAVRYVAVDALAGIIGWLVVAVLMSYLGCRIRYGTRDWGKDAKEGAMIGSWAMTILPWFGVAIAVAILLARVLEPTGALVLDALGRAW